MLFFSKKYGQTILAFILVLALFLVGLDSFFFLREQNKHALEQEEKAHHDLKLIGAFVVEPMLQQEFSTVEQFLLQWGRNTPDVAALHAFFPQGQTLAEFKRDLPAEEVLLVSTPIYFEGQHLLTLEIVKDLAPSAAPLQRFKRDLLLFSLTVTFFIGTVLWFLLRSMAIRPLEREITRRELVEEELHQAHDLLEDRVKERTRELTRVVEDLHREVGERNRAEHELAAEKERLMVTLRSIGEGVICTDIEGRVTLLNKAAERLTGWEQHDAMGNPLEEVFRLIDGETRAPLETPVAKVLRTGQITMLSGHVLLTVKSGGERDVADSAAPIRNEQSEMVGAVLVFRDETEKNRLTAEMLKVKKLESVGVLAGGIAHDFNNILAAILGNIDLALSQIICDEKTSSLLKAAKKASLRAKKLTGQLLTFAKGGEPVKQLAAIGEVIRDSAEFVLRGSNVRGNFQLADDLWPVSMDSGQISQVVQNIIINAAQAMLDGGVVDISCRNVHQDKHGKDSGNYVCIVIRDSGVGIPANLLDNIFDPYFTTKKEGHGLGLAVTHSIVAKHGGRIMVESEVGEGTTFTIHLPAFPGAKLAEEPAVIRRKKAAGRQARILVMDDDEMIRDITRDVLDHLGYKVVLAADGQEALRLYREHLEAGTPIDLTIMDLTIPGGMGGKETIRELLDFDPQAKVIVASGYSNDPVMANYKKYGFAAMLSKPFDTMELSAEIDRILAG
ncbi:MAG: ATP-binding protein [Desulfobulbaceae bacterium]|nr:ATP-binding protein [Desulfobulbaceae bacterium]HIJ89914.1 response regulator [Deltaproteobacteria bacterium]